MRKRNNELLGRNWLKSITNWNYCAQELLEIGVGTIVVPGIIPSGCTSAYLTNYGSSNKEDYDPETGCLIWVNQLVEYHNQLLKMQLNQIRELHPHATVIFADFYNAAMPLFRSPQTYGTFKLTLIFVKHVHVRQLSLYFKEKAYNKHIAVGGLEKKVCHCQCLIIRGNKFQSIYI